MISVTVSIPRSRTTANTEKTQTTTTIQQQRKEELVAGLCKLVTELTKSERVIIKHLAGDVVVNSARSHAQQKSKAIPVTGRGGRKVGEMMRFHTV
jgi:hypothetical protein